MKTLSSLLWPTLLLTTACSADPSPAEAPASPEAGPEAGEGAEAPPAPASRVHAYEAAARALVAAIDGGAHPKEVGEHADGLTRLGLEILDELRAEHPVCAPYFDALVAAAPTMGELSHEQIEADYHADGKLPEMPDPVCYHGKDLVVHPATVSVMARAGLGSDEERAAAKAEITEVLAHLQEVGDEGAGADAGSTAEAAPGTLAISAGDAMQFSVTELTAVAGEPLTLTLTHSGTLPKATMGHNWVLLREGTDREAFATAAAQASETEYIPADREGEILARTRLLGGGESETIRFTVDEPGTYEFLCTFPGHGVLMRGTLVVTEG